MIAWCIFQVTLKYTLAARVLCIYTGGVVKDQAEADKDTNPKQRIALAIGMLIPKAHMQHYNGYLTTMIFTST